MKLCFQVFVIYARIERKRKTMQEMPFYGRDDELERLHLLTKKKTSSLVVIKGRRRIDKNILSSTGFMGRISLELFLEELSLPICDLFWRKKKISAYEKFKILSVIGGVPRYLEEIDPDLTAEQNI